MSFFEERKKMLEASTETEQFPYKKRAHFATGEGVLYEECNLALVFLRCLRKGVQFLLTSNDDAAGKFDDVVLCWTKDGSPVSALLVQLKHKESGQKTIRTTHLKSHNSDFSIKKYHESYMNIKDNLDGDRYAVVLSTNAELSEDAKKMFSKCSPESVPGTELLETGGCLYSLNKDNDYVKRSVPGDGGFVQNFYLFCNQCNTKTIKSQIIAELELLLAADENYCAGVCDFLCGRVREWINTEEVCLTSRWKSWLDISDRYIKEKVTMCNSVVTKIKFSSVDALRAHIERHNPAWIRPPGPAAAALSATRAHQAVCGESHIMVSVAHLTEMHQKKVLSCWGRFCRWLVLVDDTEKSCDIQHHMVKLAGPERRLIIVSHKGDDLFHDTYKSADIPDDTWKELLNVKIELNSEQYLCCLGDLCDMKALKAMVDGKLETVVALSQLTGPVRMGQDLDPLPDNYIHRELISRMRVTEEFFSSLGNDDVCIVDKVSYNLLINIRVLRNVVKFEELEKHLSASNADWPLFGVTEDIDLPVIQMICSEYHKIHVYVLSYVDNGWEILFLHRGSAEIRPHVEEQSRSLLQIVDGLSSRIIIDGKPGIGKSTFMLDIASQLKGKNASWWILRINLLTYSEVFNSYSSSVEAVKEILLRVVRNEKNVGMLEHLLLQHCLKEYAHIICLVDGFDEVCPEYADICLQALQQLAPRRGKLVVTTRPSMTGSLESAMGVLAHSLPAFSEEELRRFHQSCNSNLGDTDKVLELLKIPLFSKMYVEALESRSVVDDIVSLYETFFERKFRRLHEEKWGNDLSKLGNTGGFERERKEQENHLGFLAVSHLLPKLEVPCTAHMSSIDRDDLVSTGIIYQFIDDKPEFIHRTFAEHFLAKWCLFHVAKCECAKVYQTALSDNSLEFFVDSFDRMASRGRPLLTAVLNGSVSEVESLLQEEADPTQKDEMGRNSLHLAAAYSRDSTLLWLLVRRLEVAGAERVEGSASGPAEETREAVNEVVVYEMGEKARLADTERTSQCVQVTSDLGLVSGLWAVAVTDPVSAALGAEDEFLQWTPLRYAVERQRWRAVPALLEAGAQPRHLRDFQRGLHDPQQLWSVFKEKGFKALLEHIAGMILIRVDEIIQVGVSIVCAEMSPQQYKEIYSEAIRRGYWEVARVLHLKIEEMQNKPTTTGSPELELNQGATLKPRHEAGLGGSEVARVLHLKIEEMQNKPTTTGSPELELNQGATLKPRHEAGLGGSEVARVLHLKIEEMQNKPTTTGSPELELNQGATLKPRHEAGLGGSEKLKEKQTGSTEERQTAEEDYAAGWTELHRAVAAGDAAGVRRLLEAGADVDMQDNEGRTAMHLAAQAGSVDCMKLLLSAGAALNVQAEEGGTALHTAARLGRRQAVRLLLAAGADTLAQDREGQTPLHEAARRGHTECVRLIARAVRNLELKDLLGYTALHRAAQCGDVASVRLLLAAGADTRAVDFYLQTPLHWAALLGLSECVRLLLQAGAGVAAKDEGGETALHWAAQEGSPECVRLLLEAGADVHEKDGDGDTPLHCAATEGTCACIRLLLQLGADVHQRNTRGQTALHRAVWEGRPESVRLLLAAGADTSAVDVYLQTPLHLAARRADPECVRLLLQAEAGVAANDEGGRTALHCAADTGSSDCVRLLLEADADVHEKDGDGDTPLHCAASKGSAACIRLLLREGADVHQRNTRGQTALHRAVWEGMPDSLRLLLQAKAGVAAKDEWGVSALDLAVWSGRPDSVRLLLAAGADTSAVDVYLQTPLHLAARRADPECVRLLLQAEAAVAAKDGRGDTALHCAARSGSPDCVRLLLAAGADVQEKVGDTPLLHWAARAASPACIRLLLQLGADVHQSNSRGDTPLHWAVCRGEAECARLLLAAGADSNAVNVGLWSPLLCAARKGHTKCVRLLLQAGADVAAKDKRGRTALHCAVQSHNPDCVRLLLAVGADIQEKNQEGDTPLHWAAGLGSAACIRLLLREGADVHQRNTRGHTALHRAVWEGRAECVRLLLEAGADIQEKNQKGDTPLHWAARAASPACIRLLLQLGADVHQRNRWAETPLHWAVWRGDAECVRLLLAAGADALAQDAVCRTPLEVAAVYKNEACLTLLNCAVVHKQPTPN